MRLALTNLDTGMFLGPDGWTVDPQFAHQFEQRETAAKAARENHVKNAAAAILEGDNLKVTGFLWLTSPS